MLARELMSEGNEDQIAITENGRYVARLGRRSARHSGSVALAGEATYLVTGGVGALGLCAARWLVAHGARRLVLASRRGTVDARARTEIESLEQSRAVVSVVSADVSRPDDVDALLASIMDGPSPLSGIVHAAGVDTVIPLRSLTAFDIDASLAAKVRGTWLLHDRTKHLDLDLFVCFSSVASVLGAQGRAHYGAANAFLDALALERRRLGLAATTVNWGPWKGGGMATLEQLEQFERMGNRGLEPQDALRALDSVVAGRDVQTVVADIDWDTFRTVYEARRPRPILTELLGREPQAQKTSKSEASAPWIEVLRAIPAAQRAPNLVTLLRREVAETLGFDDPESVPVDANFYEIGMDSLMMADLVSRLTKRLGTSYNALVFDHPDVRSLAFELIQQLPLEEAPTPAPAGIGGLTASASEPIPPAGLTGSALGSIVAEHAVPGKPISGYEATAVSEIFSFQARAWPHRNPDLIPARWRWMFVDSAHRLGVDPRIWLYRDQGRIVGYMGSIAVRVKLGDEERQTGWLVDTMVLEEYRNQGVGPRLMVDAHEDQPFSLSLGQTVEMREIQFRLGWKQVAPLQVARLLIRPEKVLQGRLPAPAAWAAGLAFRTSHAARKLVAERTPFNVRSIERFDERHDRLWTSASRDLTCAVVRDASYLNWKYVDQPGQQFLRLEVADDQGIKGVAVWMFREPNRKCPYRRAFLVDLVAPLADATSLLHVIKAAYTAVSGEADALLCRHTDGRLTRALRRCGFHLRQPDRFLLVDPGPLTGVSLDRALSSESWFVTQGDSDIDRPW